jgi:hypothetical protein
VLPDRGPDGVLVLQPRLDERDVGRDVLPDAGRQVVEHDDPQPPLAEGPHDVGADVAGAAGEQPAGVAVGGSVGHGRPP